MKTRMLLAGAALISVSTVASAATDYTLPAGGSLPFDNRQPALAVTRSLLSFGIYPVRDEGGSYDSYGGTLGFVYDFAGNFPPGSSLLANGSLVSIASNTALFSLLGTMYGGDGRSTFALPNLMGTAVIGLGAAPGVTGWSQGEAVGQTWTTLTTAQLPAHTHLLGDGRTTGATGGGQAFSNMMPSLPMRRLIATGGTFPSQSSRGNSAFIGQLATFAGAFTPAGWLEADGSLLRISDHTTLFSVIGTTYGGDGMETFALPDLRGRLSVGSDGNHPLGSSWGSEATILTSAQMPEHTHPLPDGQGTAGSGGVEPVANHQPSLSVNFLIATEGFYPGREGGTDFVDETPTLGQITEFAGNFAPRGWAFANGQLLSISSNTALFSLLGTTYGGDGRTTFALPDLRGRTLIGGDNGFGQSDTNVGDVVGTDQFYLGASLPSHVHSVAVVPEPSTWAMFGAGLAVVVLRRRRRFSNMHIYMA